MSEQKDWAAFYQQHKDDPDVWGKPEEDVLPARRGGLRATITVRFSPEEAAEIRDLAEKLGVSYSAIVRRAVGAFVHPRPMFENETGGFQSERKNIRDISVTNARTSTGQLALAR